MQPIYEASTGSLIIEWYESKKDRSGKITSSSPVHHYFKGTPTTLQLHPKDEKQVVRATFTGKKHGKMPLWIEKYAKEHHFECQQVTHQGEEGWWLANWRIYPTNYKPIATPHVAGAITQLGFLIPDVCEGLRAKLVENKEIAQQNLNHYPTIYQPFGLFFRKEEIQGKGGSLLVQDDLFITRNDGETDEEYRVRIEQDGRLEKLIYELITPLPDPVVDVPTEIEEEILDEEMTLEFTEEPLDDNVEIIEEDEDVLDFDFEDVSEEEELLDFEFEDVSEQEIVPDLEFDDIPGEELEEFKTEETKGTDGEEILSEDLEPPVGLSGTGKQEQEPLVELTDEESVSEPSDDQMEEEVITLSSVEPVSESEPALQVIEQKDKKTGACEGQFALF